LKPPPQWTSGPTVQRTARNGCSIHVDPDLAVELFVLEPVEGPPVEQPPPVMLEEPAA
jgi:hypothetical protein